MKREREEEGKKGGREGEREEERGKERGETSRHRTGRARASSTVLRVDP